jgi:hypothetical protein
MRLSQLTASQLAKAVSLIKKKEKLQGKLAAIDAQLADLEAAKVKVEKIRSKVAAAPRKKGKKRGRISSAILALLTAAGPKGLTVREIGEKIKKKPALVFAWYYASRKKLKGLKKVGPGRYAYQA